jgi:tryptophan synthase/phosphate transporter
VAAPRRTAPRRRRRRGSVLADAASSCCTHPRINNNKKMKFTHVLKFNSVPEWKDYYINYSALKKALYDVARAEYEQGYRGKDGAASGPPEDASGGGSRDGSPDGRSFSLPVTSTGGAFGGEGAQGQQQQLARASSSIGAATARVGAALLGLAGVTTPPRRTSQSGGGGGGAGGGGGGHRRSSEYPPHEEPLLGAASGGDGLTAALAGGAEGGAAGLLAAPDAAGGGSGGDEVARLERDFVRLLDAELAKIIQFYLRKESELLGLYEAAALRAHAAEGTLPADGTTPPSSRGGGSGGLHPYLHCASFERSGSGGKLGVMSPARGQGSGVAAAAPADAAAATAGAAGGGGVLGPSSSSAAAAADGTTAAAPATDASGAPTTTGPTAAASAGSTAAAAAATTASALAAAANGATTPSQQQLPHSAAATPPGLASPSLHVRVPAAHLSRPPSAAGGALLLPGAGGSTHATDAARAAFWARPCSRALAAERDALKQTVADVYVQLTELINYLAMNRTGFRKILKKHDKAVSRYGIQQAYMHVVDSRLQADARAPQLEAAAAEAAALYSVIACKGSRALALEELKEQLRDTLHYERATVWRDMVALERRAGAAAVVDAPGGARGAGALPGARLLTGGADATKPGMFALAGGWFKRNHQPLAVAFSGLVFAALLSDRSLFPGEPEKQGCLAMLVFCSLLWSTEAVPLFVTSMLVPLLVVTLRVLVDPSSAAADPSSPPRRLEPKEAAPAIFHAMFGQVVMLLLGGFAIAAALSKHYIAKQLAVAVLSRAGRRPRDVLLANMLVATFASMWISNVAAPVLCFSLVQPILRTLPSGHPFGKALVMGIALASNLGGMTSPISSPQNIFAVERMSADGEPPSWLAWFAVALPVAVLGNLACWLMLLAAYKPGARVREVRPLKPSSDPMTGTQLFVVFVSVATVALWCCNSLLSNVTGEMGVLAIIPLVAFFGTGVLSKDDFNGFLWNVVMLAMGGSALGEAVRSSGLLSSIAAAITEVVKGYGLWQVCAAFCGLVLVATTFVSHTVGAMVILPIVQSVGEEMARAAAAAAAASAADVARHGGGPSPPLPPAGPPSPHPHGKHPGGHAKLLVMAAALTCSGAMGMPVSGFPNMQAVSLEDAAGNQYVGTLDFLAVGIPGSVAAYGIIVTVGYALMRMVGF